MQFSIILPVYNQADHIEAVLAEYAGALARQPYDHEFILVVNGSRDRSLEVCQALAARDTRLHVLHSDTGGWGLAVRMGLAESRGDLVCYTNSARTSAQDLMLFLLYATANPGVVIKANRRIRESAQRRIGSLLYNIECRVLFDLAYWDINGTPKVFPRSFDRLFVLERNDDLIDLEFNTVCRRESYPVLEVPILSVRRHGGKSSTNYLSAVHMYWGAFRLWQQTRQNAK